VDTATLALIIFFAILVQVGGYAVYRYFRYKRQQRDSESGTGESNSIITPFAAPRSTATVVAEEAPAWEGFKDFVVQRRVMEDGAKSACSFYLAPVDGELLPPFKPGQFLTFKLQVPDPTTGERKEIVRCYSLSDRPRSDYYRITIKRVSPPADRPDVPAGISSNFFHDHVQVGTRLSIKAPSGPFHLIETEPLPVVLVAGGIGLTPMLSIVNSMLHSGNPREVWLFYGVRNGSEHVMKEHLESLAKAHPNFHLHVCYSQPTDKDIAGVDYQHPGHVDLQRLRLSLQLLRYQFYVCGPRAMMESLVPALEQWGVDASDIHYEAFGPASLPRHAKPKPAGAAQKASPKSVTVTFGKSGKRLAWNPAAESLLEFAEDNGIRVDSGCRAGSCGTCQTALETGEVEYSQDPDAEIAPGHCLLCISTPLTDLKLNA